MELVNSIWQGLLTGIVLSLMLGTVFFSLIRNSILSGFKTGVYIALGVIICDIIFILLALLSTGFARFLEEYQNTVSAVASLVLLLMGLLMIFNSKPKDTEGRVFEANQKNPWYYIGNGFLLNLLNPVNFFSWLAITAVLKFEMRYGIELQASFFIACLSGIFVMEFAIAYFASLLKKKITPTVIKRINQISGLVFMGAALKLLYQASLTLI